MRGVIFGSLTDDDTGSQTRDNREGEAEPVFNTQEVEDGESSDSNEHGAHVGTKGQRTEQIPHRGTFLSAYQEDSQQRQEYTHRSNQHGGDDSLQLNLQTRYAKSCSTQSRGREDRATVALIQVGTHAGYVAYIITHIISNGGRIAGIILRNVSLNLTYNIGTHVGSLGIDTTTYTGKQSLRRSTHTEGQHGGSNGDESHLVASIEIVEHQEPDSNVEQSQSDNRQTHHST